MKFCPLCFQMLLIQASTTGTRMVCHVCRYFHNINRQQKVVIKYQKDQTIEIVEQNQEIKSFPTIMTLCPKCLTTKAYFESRQTRGADEASTIFYTCVSCNHKWNEN